VNFFPGAYLPSVRRPGIVCSRERCYSPYGSQPITTTLIDAPWTRRVDHSYVSYLLRPMIPLSFPMWTCLIATLSRSVSLVFEGRDGILFRGLISSVNSVTFLYVASSLRVKTYMTSLIPLLPPSFSLELYARPKNFFSRSSARLAKISSPAIFSFVCFLISSLIIFGISRFSVFFLPYFGSPPWLPLYYFLSLQASRPSPCLLFQLRLIFSRIYR